MFTVHISPLKTRSSLQKEKKMLKLDEMRLQVVIYARIMVVKNMPALHS